MFQQIKQLLKIEDVVQFYHEAPRKNKYLCPFHDDRHPSLSIEKNIQIFKCFVCETKGDLITFTARLFGLSNYDACKKLNDDFRLNLLNEKLSRKQIIDTKRKQIIFNKKKQERLKLIDDLTYWVETFAKYDRICIDNQPLYQQEVSNLWTVCNEIRLMSWEKLKESEVELWKLKNSQK